MIVFSLTPGSYIFTCHGENRQVKKYQVKKNVLFLVDGDSSNILCDFVNSIVINDRTICFLNSGNIVHMDNFHVLEIRLPDLIYRISEELNKPEIVLYGLRALSDNEKEKALQIITEELGF